MYGLAGVEELIAFEATRVYGFRENSWNSCDGGRIEPCRLC